MKNSAPVRVAIFASGTGSNAEALIKFERSATSSSYHIALIFTNNPKAGVVEIAHRYDLPVSVVTPEPSGGIIPPEPLLEELERQGIDVVCLAGFLRKIPEDVTRKFAGRIINIHPALLPRHGGEGMYGRRVFESILTSGDTSSGVTIHHVSAEYDQGEILCQQSFALESSETVESLTRKTRTLEHRMYPEVLSQLASDLAFESSSERKNSRKRNSLIM